MAGESLTWYGLLELVPELESLRLAARGTQINANHPRWCRVLAWSTFLPQIRALVGPDSGATDRRLLRWSSLDVARLVIFLGMPPCPRGCEHRHEKRERHGQTPPEIVHAREMQEVGT